MDDSSKPGEACRTLPGKEHGAKQLVLSKPTLQCVLKAKTQHGVYHAVNVYPAAREKERSCEAFHTCVQLIQSWQRDTEPCLGAFLPGICRGAGCWHVECCNKSSLTEAVLCSPTFS